VKDNVIDKAMERVDSFLLAKQTAKQNGEEILKGQKPAYAACIFYLTCQEHNYNIKF
jgi:hypothetical protein